MGESVIGETSRKSFEHRRRGVESSGADTKGIGVFFKTDANGTRRFKRAERVPKRLGADGETCGIGYPPAADAGAAVRASLHRRTDGCGIAQHGASGPHVCGIGESY